MRRWQEIDDERPDVEDVDQRNDPLENCGDVVFAVLLRDSRTRSLKRSRGG